MSVIWYCETKQSKGGRELHLTYDSIIGCDTVILKDNSSELPWKNIGSSQSEVTNLNMIVWIKENIHWFQVPVNHSLLMDVSQTFNNLPEQSPHSLVIFKQPTVDSSPTTVKSTLLYDVSQTATFYHNNGNCDWEITTHPEVYTLFSGRVFRYLVKITDQDGYHNWGFCGLL